MLNKRSILSFLIIFTFTLALAWYFMLKKYDYQVSFRVPMSTGSAYHKVAEWKDWNFKKGNQSIEIEKRDGFEYLSQRVAMKDTSYTIDWTFSAIDGMNTQVNIGIVDHHHSILNRFKTILGSSSFELDFIDHVYEIGKGLTDYSKSYIVDLHGTEVIGAIDYVYVPLKSTVTEKANAMIAHNYMINTYLADNEAKIFGKPFVKVNTWNWENDSIHFDFCFPVKSTSGMTAHTEIRLGKLKEQKAFKAAFFGNYSKSHEAWYSILDHTQNSEMALESTPIEFFHNNPYDGGDELTWKAEVFFPVR